MVKCGQWSCHGNQRTNYIVITLCGIYVQVVAMVTSFLSTTTFDHPSEILRTNNSVRPQLSADFYYRPLPHGLSTTAWTSHYGKYTKSVVASHVALFPQPYRPPQKRLLSCFRCSGVPQHFQVICRLISLGILPGNETSETILTKL